MVIIKKGTTSQNDRDKILFKMNKLKDQKADLLERYQNTGMTYEIYITMNHKLETAIAKCEVEYNMELIKEHLIKKGASRVVVPNRTDKIDYAISEYCGVILFKYTIEYVDSNKERRHDKGLVINDVDGNIIHEQYDFNLPANCKINKTKYTHLPIYDVFTYIDEDNIIIERKDEEIVKLNSHGGETEEIPLTVHVYDHYKKVDGKYIKVNTIKRDRTLKEAYNQPIGIEFKELNPTDGKKLCQCFGRLYSIEEGEFLSSLIFDKILDAKSTDFPHLGCNYGQASEQLSRILKDNNLLAGTTKIELWRDDYIDTLVYMDTEGNIVSDLYYYMSLEDEEIKDEPDEIEHVETTNETYNDALASIIELGENRAEELDKQGILRYEEEQEQKREKENKRLKFLATTYKPKNKAD